MAPAQRAARVRATHVRTRKLIMCSTVPPMTSRLEGGGKSAERRARGNASQAHSARPKLHGVGNRAARTRLQRLSMSTSMQEHWMPLAEAVASAVTNSSPTSTDKQSITQYKAPKPERVNAQAWQSRRRNVRRGYVSGTTWKEPRRQPRPLCWQRPRSCSPLSRGRSSTGTGGKAQLRVCRATLRSSSRGPVPTRQAGSSGAELTTSRALAPARAALCAFAVNVAQRPASSGPPRRTNAKEPQTSGHQWPTP
mmetsp:Transcript_120597/g.375488  ORF Transcript_120597/g.375488 Transcript_120597/m.375488 type:complete len:252 (+) Transcript_120597:324-1079(+)